ncbi:MAG: L-histidine N(alpha)-methyltransferase [Chitinophagales bacterium]
MANFIKDVDEGLSKASKTLSSKYFYDKKGDALFVEIMRMPEYYLTRAEFEILQKQAVEITKTLSLNPDTTFEIIELGAGDGEKTKEFIRYLMQENFKFKYMPVDISQNVLGILQNSMLKEFPNLKIAPMQGDYFQVLEGIKHTHHPKLVLFLGSNIGNLKDENAQKFLKQIGQKLSTGDHLLLGVDLIKPAEIVVPAYNDAKGITAAFNLNILERINRELDGDFDLSAFHHEVDYTQELGIVKSYLVSNKDQKVYIGQISKSYSFRKGERINTEISRKYNDAMIEKITRDTSFETKAKFTDSKGYFADYILVKT